MFSTSEWLLVGAVAGVGVLHTMVPDHWVPITLIARQQRWTRLQTARASLQAGAGHVLSTLLIALIVWVAGVALAKTVGHWVSIITSAALVAFGGWIAVSAWLDIRKGGHSHSHGHGHSHSHGHGHDHGDDAHGHDRPKAGRRTALLLILGSSPMVEGIPAFFAAGRYGLPLIVVMSLVFAATTILTYVLLCVGSVIGLKRVSFGALERFGEVMSGAFIALVGVVFWIFPVL